MYHQILEGFDLAHSIRSDLKQKLAKALSSNNKLRPPKLAVVLVGELTPSLTYVNAKKRAAEEVGIKADIISFSSSVTLEELTAALKKLELDEGVDGILIQLPLPPHLDPLVAASLIPACKDVDGLSIVNIGKLVTGQKSGFVPCTPKAILRLLRHYQIRTKSAPVTILGRSLIVGRPLSILLSHPSWEGQATVTLAHSQTASVKNLLQNSSIIIAAMGQPHFLDKSMISPGTVVIDVGITKNEKGQLQGDLNPQGLDPTIRFTPVPKGVGPMTVAMLLENVLLSWQRRFDLDALFPID